MQVPRPLVPSLQHFGKTKGGSFGESFGEMLHAPLASPLIGS
jgi:hypothetical protein